MPQIKLAQGFSDIKGKSNGSVFSRNRQGVYFRNNPSGGGKKSNKWNAQKNRFGALSTAWKNLTEVEQQAWSDIAPLYPALNKFGDSYIASGYQTFMRLNGTINALGYPLLRTPNAPRETPTFDEPTFYIPDNFCFTPNRVAYLGDIESFMVERIPGDDSVARSLDNRSADAVRPKKNGVGVQSPKIPRDRISGCLAIYCDDLFQENNDVPNSIFAVRFVPQAGTPHVFSSGQVLPLMLIGDNEQKNTQAYIYVIDAKTSYLCLSSFFQNDDEDQFLYFSYTIISNELVNSGFHFGLHYDVSNDNGFKLFLDGAKIELLDNSYYANPSIDPAWVLIAKPTSTTTPSEINSFTKSAVLTLGFPDALGINLFNVSDFRFISQIDAPDWECDDDSECEPLANETCVNGWCTPDPELGIPNDVLMFSMLAYGYVLGYETVIVPLSNYVDGYFPSVAGVGREISMGYVSSLEDLLDKKFPLVVYKQNFIVYQNLHSYIPMVYLERVDCGSDGFALNISCTGNVSAGRSLNQVPYKSLASVPLNSDSFLLSPSMVQNFGSIAENSFYDFKVFLLDTTTGLLGGSPVPSVKKPRRDRATRWKAGSDLSSSVN
jgi:hypothetical protein